MKPIRMEEAMQQYKNAVAYKKTIYEQYKNCDDDVSFNKRKESLGLVHDATVAYAKLYHGPHYDELERLYKDAVHNYVTVNSSVKDNCPTEVQQTMIHQLYLDKDIAEHNIYGCVKNL